MTIIDPRFLPNLSATYVPQSEVGAPSGVASLDVSGKIPVSQLPSVVMEYQGSWDPTTNTPALADGTGTNGFVYYVSALDTGTVVGLTDPSMTNFQIGDLVVYSSSIGKWQLVTPAAGVQSVNGAQGAVTVNAINQLTGDVLTTTASGSQSKVATLNAITNNTITTLSALSLPGSQITGNIPGHASLDLLIANNLSDVSNPATGLTNLGLGSNSAFIPNTSGLLSYYTPGIVNKARNIQVVGNIAYMTMGQGLYYDIYNVSNKDIPPVLISSPTTSQLLNNFKVVGNYLYAAGNTGSMYIWNVTNPAAVTLTSTTTYAGSGQYFDIDVDAAGAFAYTADTNAAGVLIWDISNKAAPVVVAQLLSATFTVTAVKVVGNYLFVNEYNNHNLYIYDITTPSSPVLLSTTSLGSAHLSSLTVSSTGNYVYSSEYASPFNCYIVDTTVKTAPVLLSTITEVSTFANSQAVTVYNDQYLYTGAGNNNIDIWDISNKSAPFKYLAIPTISGLNVTGIFVDATNTYFYVADRGNNSIDVYSFDSVFNIDRIKGKNATFTTINGTLYGSATSFRGSLTGDITGTQGATVVSKIQTKVVSGTTGTGNVVFSASPTLTGTAIIPAISGDVSFSTGNVLISTLGKGLQVKSGTNAKIGTAVLVGGTVTVANTSITANSRIFITANLDGGTVGFHRVSAKTVGTSFVITSSSALDTSTVAWMIVESI